MRFDLDTLNMNHRNGWSSSKPHVTAAQIGNIRTLTITVEQTTRSINTVCASYLDDTQLQTLTNHQLAVNAFTAKMFAVADRRAVVIHGKLHEPRRDFAATNSRYSARATNRYWLQPISGQPFESASRGAVIIVIDRNNPNAAQRAWFFVRGWNGEAAYPLI